MLLEIITGEGRGRFCGVAKAPQTLNDSKTP